MRAGQRQGGRGHKREKGTRKEEQEGRKGSREKYL